MDSFNTPSNIYCHAHTKWLL